MKGIKTGGRRKGTPNKRTVELQAKLDSLDFDPTVQLVTELRKDVFDKDKAKILMDLHEYLYARRKPLEEPAEKPPIDVTPVTPALDLTDAELLQISKKGNPSRS